MNCEDAGERIKKNISCTLRKQRNLSAEATPVLLNMEPKTGEQWHSQKDRSTHRQDFLSTSL